MTSDGIELVTAENDLYAKLMIPTQSEGATFDAYSTQVGDSITVGNTGGSIEEDPYEDYVSRLSISTDVIEIGLLLSKDTHATIWRPQGTKTDAKRGKEPDRTLRIPTDEITDIRQEEIKRHPGLAFETDTDLYQLKFAGGARETMQDKIGQAIEMIERGMGGTESTANTTSDESPSTIEELERLAELHDQGVLTDEEFQKAKSQIIE